MFFFLNFFSFCFIWWAFNLLYHQLCYKGTGMSRLLEPWAGLLNVTLAGAPCNATPPLTDGEMRREYQGCQNLPTALWHQKPRRTNWERETLRLTGWERERERERARARARERESKRERENDWVGKQINYGHTQAFLSHTCIYAGAC